jgi:hypothetical protein
MNDPFLTLVESETPIELAHLEVEGKTEGHGRIVVNDRSIVLRAITKATAGIRPGEDVKVKATTLDGRILRISGCLMSINNQLQPLTEYQALLVRVNAVRARASGKDPDEDLTDTPEEITINIAIPKLIASNATTTTSVQISTLGIGSQDTTRDCLILRDNTFILEKGDLRITWKRHPNQDANCGIPLLAAVAYLHGAPAWYYYQRVQTRKDRCYVLRNNLKIPITSLTPLTKRLADLYPDHAINVVNSASTLLSEHQFREKLHDVVHNFIVGTARVVDGVAATLVAAAATEGLCRVLQNKKNRDAKQIIGNPAKELGLPKEIIDLGLTSWQRVRNTLAHGHFYLAHDRDAKPDLPRSANENILHDLSRVSGLFHAILLKTAGYSGPVAISKFEDRDAEI